MSAFIPSHNIFKVCPYGSTSQGFVPFYGHVIVHDMDLPHFVIRSSVDEHLGSFHLLATLNSAAVNIICLNICLHLGVGGSYKTSNE